MKGWLLEAVGEEHSGEGPEVRTGLCWSGWHSGWEESSGGRS